MLVKLPVSNVRSADSLKSFFTYFLLAIPFVGYLGNVAIHVVNVPFLDDYPALLEPVNRILVTPAWRDKLAILFSPHNDFHPLVVERLVFLSQSMLGEGNIAHYLLLSNLGWALTAAILVFYFCRVLGAPLLYLIPIPYLMLSNSHWEAIDFATPAFCFYWGGGVFAVLAVIMAVMGRGIGAGLFCALALMSVGGTQALLPPIVLLFLLTKQWKTAVLFLLSVGLLISPYIYLIGLPQAPKFSLLYNNPIGIVRYVLIFMGNYFSTGEYDLARLNTVFLCVGTGVLLTSGLLLWLCRSKIHESLVPLVLIVYVLQLAAMAALVRFDLPIVSRYSMYALLAGAALYGWCVAVWAREKSATFMKVFVGAVIACGMVYWAYTLYVTQTPFRQNHQRRLENMARYAHGGDINALELLSFDPHYADRVLRESRELGVYNFSPRR